MTGTFKKIVHSFEDGLTEMIALVDEVKIEMAPILWNCRGSDDLERDIIESLRATDTGCTDVCCASNRAPFIPQWNNNGALKWHINNAWVPEDAIRYGITYRTSEDFSFGWQKTAGYCVFFAAHPKREMLGEKSSLRNTLISAGWHETGEVVGTILITSYECDYCGGTHGTYLTISRDYKYRNYMKYPKVMRGGGYGAPYVEIEYHDCEGTRGVDRLQVVGRESVTIDEAKKLAKEHGVEIPHGFFDPITTNVIAGFFTTVLNKRR